MKDRCGATAVQRWLRPDLMQGCVCGGSVRKGEEGSLIINLLFDRYTRIKLSSSLICFILIDISIDLFRSIFWLAIFKDLILYIKLITKQLIPVHNPHDK